MTWRPKDFVKPSTTISTPTRSPFFGGTAPRAAAPPRTQGSYDLANE
ncbi:hypothetical protein LI90_3772 [Carbonactinospora thermoautotrophica]|uniref:Uncharacterized protein n=1 Tax=Carbonactinospora thermoautotrophica TaxID=1469144 RepID=A0A132MXZ5_9ACTN|nr:hypothetical protein LI90_3772 [Carbonactinospora thermoautotrophica]